MLHALNRELVCDKIKLLRESPIVTKTRLGAEGVGVGLAGPGGGRGGGGGEAEDGEGV